MKQDPHNFKVDPVHFLFVEIGCCRKLISLGVCHHCKISDHVDRKGFQRMEICTSRMPKFLNQPLVVTRGKEKTTQKFEMKGVVQSQKPITRGPELLRNNHSPAASC